MRQNLLTLGLRDSLRYRAAVDENGSLEAMEKFLGSLSGSGSGSGHPLVSF